MIAAGKKSRSRARQKLKLEGGVESSLRWGCEKKSSRGRWVAEHIEEIGGAFKWREKFEWNPKIITHKAYLNKQKKQQMQKLKEANIDSNKKNKEIRKPKWKTTSGRKVVGGKWPECEERATTGDNEPGRSQRESIEGRVTMWVWQGK